MRTARGILADARLRVKQLGSDPLRLRGAQDIRNFTELVNSPDGGVYLYSKKMSKCAACVTLRGTLCIVAVPC